MTKITIYDVDYRPEFAIEYNGKMHIVNYHIRNANDFVNVLRSVGIPFNHYEGLPGLEDE